MTAPRIAARARAAWLRLRDALPRRRSIATRMIATLSLLACGTSGLSLVLLDLLSSDLEAAARARLDGSANAAERLFANYLGDALTRWQAISRTPEFRANLEVANLSTLRYFARQLANSEHASLVVFRDRRARTLASAGDVALDDVVREALKAASSSDPVASPDRNCVSPRAEGRSPARTEFESCAALKAKPVATMFGHERAGYALIRVPLLTQGRLLGELLVTDPVPDELLADWSAAIGATLRLETGSGSTSELTADVVRMNGLVARVETSNAAERDPLTASRWRMVAAGAFALSIGLLLAIWMGSTLARPIQALRDATVQAGRGDLDVRVDATRRDEIGDVARAFNRTLESLRESRDRLYHLAYHDPLTNVGNRRSFQDELARRLNGAPGAAPLALMLIDLTRFKAVNDTLGIPTGDEVLKQATARIVESFGASARGAQIGLWRLGGNEFALLLARDDLEQAAQRILERFESPFHVSGQRVLVGVRIGIAPDVSGRSPSEAMRSCDIALRDAKRRGGTRYAVYDSSMDAPVLRRHAMEARLRAAVAAGALDVAYQPRVEAATGRILGFEALVRWTDPDFGAVSPQEFVRLAEEMRIVVAMGELVLRRAVQQLAAWREQLPSQHTRVSVNVSQHQLTGSFVEVVASILTEHRVDPSQLELEITETALMQDQRYAVQVLTQLRSSGIRIALDDFGSGYSSLGMLRQLPVSVLKMDRVFVSALGDDSDAYAIAAAIVGVARVYGMEVVAEGVETAEQRDLLAELGCDELQGYLFAPPLAVEDATRALEVGTLETAKTS